MPANLIKKQLPLAPTNSGVYQFFDDKDQILYVGKAKNLQKRLSSYTKPNQLSTRIARMVFLAQRFEFIQTENEVEALLLEHNLIKKLSPRFNILLKDDKTFPQILITHHRFPQITKYRGNKSDKGAHFGPFASAHDVNHTIDILKKIFRLRDCSDSEFNSRKKPCLEYQIKRCSAPCMDLISQDDYQSYVSNAIDFLGGKSGSIQKDFTAKMKKCSDEQDYEKAATLRDQIKSLDAIQAKQNINIKEIKDADIVTAVALNGKACIYIGFFRAGRNLGAKPYFYDIETTDKYSKDLSELVTEFLGQFYLYQIPPKSLLLNLDLKETDLMEKFLEKSCGRRVEISTPKRGKKSDLIKNQTRLALQNLEQRISQNLSTKSLLLEVKKLLNLAKMPQRIEVYDNSHTGGTNAIGAFITAGIDGFIKSGYRTFNLNFELSKKRDDTAMMREVLTRRFSKIKKEEHPDLIIIDGGKGQLSAATETFKTLNIKIPLVCMSKGEDRNAGEEYFHQDGKDSFTLPKQHPVMFYLQRLRDEAHRFAITTHRKKREKAALL